jgi:hypothetical protein
VDRGTTVTLTGIAGGDATNTSINAAEARDGIVITGTAEAGSTVVVNGVTATVAANGTYTATIPAPATDGPLVVNVATTDAAGNTATATQTLTVDRGTTVAITSVEGGDNTINAAEAAAGIVITGTAEAGSTVVVTASQPLWRPTAPTRPRSRLRRPMVRWLSTSRPRTRRATRPLRPRR